MSSLTVISDTADLTPVGLRLARAPRDPNEWKGQSVYNEWIKLNIAGQEVVLKSSKGDPTLCASTGTPPFDGVVVDD